MGNISRDDGQAVDLVEAYDDHGNIVWVEPEAVGVPQWAEPRFFGTDGPRGVQTGELVVADGNLYHTSSPAVGPRPVSMVPQCRMSGGLEPMGWEQVTSTIGDHEQGLNLDTDVYINPGGYLALGTEGASNPGSVVPSMRMAASARPCVYPSDIEVIRRLDPTNLEAWRSVRTTVLDGWRFRLQVRPEGFVFEYLAFRSPTESNRWRLCVINPNVDDQWGHRSHIVTCTVNGWSLPVLCAQPGAAPARNLAEVRAQAAKWSAYTQDRIDGRAAAFSQ